MAGDVFVAERAKSGTGLSALVRHWFNLRQHRIAPQVSWMRFLQRRFWLSQIMEIEWGK